MHQSINHRLVYVAAEQSVRAVLPGKPVAPVGGLPGGLPAGVGRHGLTQREGHQPKQLIQRAGILI